MDFAQDRVTTLHALSGADRVPEAPTERSAVLVPMAVREGRSDAGPESDRVFEALEAIAPERVVVALRAPADRVPSIRKRLDSYALSIELLWCNGPRMEELLREYGLDGPAGKGQDVWLGLALAADSQFVAIHDADVASYTAAYVPRLLAPLAAGGNKDGDGKEDEDAGSEDGAESYRFVKGYYARVEDDRLYGRLCRLLYAPLVRTLATAHDAPVLSYLDGFRYGLAGECAMDTDLAHRLRYRRGWGLEVGLLGEGFRVAGSRRVAQVDLGSYDHEHRPVDGVAGLSTMAASIADALLQVLEERGVEPDYASLPERYRERARRFLEAYRADAAFNGLAYDAAGERRQIAAYAEAIAPPRSDDRLPAWTETELAPASVRAAARADLEALAPITEGSTAGGVSR